MSQNSILPNTVCCGHYIDPILGAIAPQSHTWGKTIFWRGKPGKYVTITFPYYFGAGEQSLANTIEELTQNSHQWDAAARNFVMDELFRNKEHSGVMQRVFDPFTKQTFKAYLNARPISGIYVEDETIEFGFKMDLDLALHIMAIYKNGQGFESLRIRQFERKR